VCVNVFFVRMRARAYACARACACVCACAYVYVRVCACACVCVSGQSQINIVLLRSFIIVFQESSQYFTQTVNTKLLYKMRLITSQT
jgi:hypothetical protein